MRSIFWGSLVAIGVLLGLLFWNQSPPSHGPRREALVVYCAAGLKPVVEAVAKDYEREQKTSVQLQYGGSGTLLSNLRVAQRGDVFIPADTSFIDLGNSNHLLAEVLPLARMSAVVVVAKGNPKNIRSIRDLLRDGVRVSLGNPDSVAIGTVARAALTRSGDWAALSARALVFKPTVNDVANDVKLGAVDAGIVWDVTVALYSELEAVVVPELSSARSEVSVCVLQSSTQPTEALRFARYLSARDRGLRRFQESGFEVMPGDVWNPHPSVLFYSGSVNRLAAEPTLREFEQREGVDITRVYNGCGILTSQIRSGQRPDAYFACDVSFMDTVQSYFQPAVALARTPLVLAVRKGNPKAIGGLSDLTRTALKVGLCQEEQSALGALSARLLRSVGLWDSVKSNLAVQSPTGDLLINQLRSGALDVALVYAANTAAVLDAVDVVRLTGPGTIAIQPYAVSRNSDHAQLMSRLQQALESKVSRDRFVSAGFQLQESLP
ncbi:MAG: molybdate ABC transporter substrate-binding protein [Verrucomicrobia bacterium]|nr:molybdate ABC transporter substrate-binding protein [Verrucomicrobiota bacterium]